MQVARLQPATPLNTDVSPASTEPAAPSLPGAEATPAQTVPATPPVVEPPAPAAPPPAAETRKLVHSFVITGNTLLPAEELARVLRVYEGRELTLSQMKEAAADITSLYQRQGYYLVRAVIPQQPFNAPDVEMAVVEGKVGKVLVEGAEHYDADFIRRRFERSVEDRQFRSDRFTRALLLLNELPDLQVKAIFEAGAPGEADVHLQVKDQLPVHGDVDYNNYGTPETGQNRIGIGFQAGNLANQGDRFSGRGVVGFPSSNNTFYQLDYETPINLDGTTVGASYANGAFAVSQGLSAILDVRGNADIFTVSAAHPLERSLDFSSNLALTLSHKDIRNTLLGGATDFTHDEYTMTRLQYTADWRGPSGRTIGQATWAQGLGGTGSGDPLVSRAGANGGFSRFNFDLARIQRVTDGLYAVFRGSVQLSTTPLYVGEQYALGGPDTVRGYQQAELLGDHAYLLGAELRWSPFRDLRDRFQFCTFIDHGGVTLINPQPGDLSRGNHLTGAGFGFRYSLGDFSNIRLDLGFPIAPSDNRNGDFPAIYAGMQNHF